MPQLTRPTKRLRPRRAFTTIRHRARKNPKRNASIVLAWSVCRQREEFCESGDRRNGRVNMADTRFLFLLDTEDSPNAFLSGCFICRLGIFPTRCFGGRA